MYVYIYKIFMYTQRWCAYIYMYVCIYAYVYTYICVYIYTHTPNLHIYIDR